MAFEVTSTYAAILALVAVVLSVLVSLHRGRHAVSILDGGHRDLALAIRRHGNFIETVPLTLILMALAETRGLGVTWLHVIGMVVVVARLLHAVGIMSDRPTDMLRSLGMLGTLVPILVLAIYLAISHF